MRAALLLFPVINHQSGKQILQIHPYIHFYTHGFFSFHTLFLLSTLMLYLSSTMYSCTSPASVCRNSPPSSTVRQFFSRDLLLMRAVQLLFSALPPTFSNPEALRGDAEPVVSGRLQRSIQFLHIEPLHTLHFLFCRISFAASTGLVYI